MSPGRPRGEVGTVSVVIASNRGGPHLAEAVESVRKQTVPVHEIILVDHGSPAPGLGKTALDPGIDYVR
jgi:GT2 family glycosyltransferase